MIADMFDWLVLPTTIHAVSRVVACVQIRRRQLLRTDLRDANVILCWLWQINLLKLLHSPLPRKFQARRRRRPTRYAKSLYRGSRAIGGGSRSIGMTVD
jgi:hypothetical protein